MAGLLILARAYRGARLMTGALSANLLSLAVLLTYGYALVKAKSGLSFTPFVSVQYSRLGKLRNCACGRLEMSLRRDATLLVLLCYRDRPLRVTTAID